MIDKLKNHLTNLEINKLKTNSAPSVGECACKSFESCHLCLANFCVGCADPRCDDCLYK